MVGAPADLQTKNTVSIQEQCYLRHKHLLYLSPWIYQNSRFFFYLREQVFLYRMLYEESLNNRKYLILAHGFAK